MKFLVRATIPTVDGNRLILQGKLSEAIDAIVGQLRPDATFFKVTEKGPAVGVKAMSMIIDLDDAAQVKAVVEPLFHALAAKVEYEAVFFPDDLTRALPTMLADVKRYGDDNRLG